MRTIARTIHLRCRVLGTNRDAFLAFLREAIPVYEEPGGIRMLNVVSSPSPIVPAPIALASSTSTTSSG